MSTFKFYFIHNFKVMGTTIHKQLPSSYNKLFYGMRTLNDVEEKNHNFKIKNIYNLDMNVKKAIDHIHYDRLIAMGFIKIPINEVKFIMIVREPIERFISVCNYRFMMHGITMENHISGLKKKKGSDFLQYKLLNNKNNIKVHLFKMEDKIGITEFFKEFGININLDIKKNVSKKTYTINDISPEDMVFLKEHFKKDSDLYNSIL